VEAGSINPAEYRSKNLDHLGIVAEVCREIGLAEERRKRNSKVRGRPEEWRGLAALIPHKGKL
jgi:hypothetical protein